MSNKKAIGGGFFLLAFLAAGYFGGGIVGATMTFYNVFEARQSSAKTLEEVDYRLYKVRTDIYNLRQRQEFAFDSGANSLVGYSYKPAGTIKGVAICAHGMRSLADGMDAMYQEYFYSKGYHVFSFDMSSCGSSTANGHDGICQSPEDVKNAYDFFYKTFPEEKDLPMYLVGHSWGGYGAVVSLEYGTAPTGVITFSGFNNPRDLLFDTAKAKVGFWAELTRPTFNIAVNMKFGNKADLTAKDVLLKHPEVKSLHIQGEKDDIVQINNTIAKNMDNAANSTSIYLPEVGHNVPWVDAEAQTYCASLKQEASTLSGADLEFFLNHIDKEKTSKFSLEVQSALDSFLNE